MPDATTDTPGSPDARSGLLAGVPPRWRIPVVLGGIAALLLGVAGGTALGLAIWSPKAPRPAQSRAVIATAVPDPAPAPAATPTPVPTATPDPATDMVGFYVNWDDTSFTSLEANIDALTAVMPMWYHVGDDGRVTVDDPSEVSRVMTLVRNRRPDLKVMPIVNNYDKGSESWNAPAVAKLIAKPAERTRIAQGIVDAMKAGGYQGVNIDFESFTEADRANLVAFQAEVYRLAKPAGLEVSQDVLVGSKAFDHAALAKHNDYLIPMMYGEHWRTSGPGPIASQGWFERALGEFVKQVPADKVVVGLGVYGRDWGTRGKNRALTFAEATSDARLKKVPIRLDPATLNSTYSYTEGSDKRTAWLLDAPVVFNQITAASKLRVRGYAIWRLGAEEPASWNVLRSRDSLDATVAASLGGGKRTVVYDQKRGLITEATVTP